MWNLDLSSSLKGGVCIMPTCNTKAVYMIWGKQISQLLRGLSGGWTHSGDYLASSWHKAWVLNYIFLSSLDLFSIHSENSSNHMLVCSQWHWDMDGLPAFHRALLCSLLELNAFANLCDSNKQSSSLKSCCDVKKRYIPWSWVSTRTSKSTASLFGKQNTTIHT